MEPPSYASTAYVVAIWPLFLFDSFVKIWDTRKNGLPPPRGKKFPVRLWNNLFRKTYSCEQGRNYLDTILGSTKINKVLGTTGSCQFQEDGRK